MISKASETGSEDNSADLKVLTAGAVRYVLADVIADFIRSTGKQVDYKFATVGRVRDRLKDGQKADVVIVTVGMLKQMAASGVIVAGSGIKLGRTLTGICVRDGALKPDISTPGAFKQSLLNARSFAYTDPTAGGTSGIYLAGVLAQLGIADAIKKKTIFCINGDEVAEKVASGEAELGSTFISEVLPVKGVIVVGPLPGSIQHGTEYAVGISANCTNRLAAKQFIEMLTSSEQQERWASAGFTPSAM